MQFGMEASQKYRLVSKKRTESAESSVKMMEQELKNMKKKRSFNTNMERIQD